MRIIRNSICPLVGQEPESDKHRRTRPYGGLLLVQRQPTWCPQGDHAVESPCAERRHAGITGSYSVSSASPDLPASPDCDRCLTRFRGGIPAICGSDVATLCAYSTSSAQRRFVSLRCLAPEDPLERPEPKTPYHRR